MAKVTVFFDLPSINKYMEGDEDLSANVAVCTFEEAKVQILEVIQKYLHRLESTTYHDWKKTHEV